MRFDTERGVVPIRSPEQHELERRRIVGVHEETVTDVTSTDFPGHYPHEDHTWNSRKFEQSFTVQFHRNEAFESVFSLVGLDASIANAFRRILIAEIPSLAIEYVFVHNNTSIMQDEVLAARLGLIPLTGGREGLRQFMKWFPRPGPETPADERFGKGFDYNTVVLELKVECTKNEAAEQGERDPRKQYNQAHIYANDIVFKPFGRQKQFFSGENSIRPTNPEILIVKMRPGQVIDLEMHAVKGVGGDHAKFSPVATATYRLLPTITITKPIVGADAEKFQRCFPEGVIALETVGKREAREKGSGYEGKEGQVKAVVKDPMRDTVSRECLRHDEFKKRVKLGRVRDHFIFSVESLGQWESDELFLESVRVLRRKCEALKQNLSDMAR